MPDKAKDLVGIVGSSSPENRLAELAAREAQIRTQIQELQAALAEIAQRRAKVQASIQRADANSYPELRQAAPGAVAPTAPAQAVPVSAPAVGAPPRRFSPTELQNIQAQIDYWNNRRR